MTQARSRSGVGGLNSAVGGRRLQRTPPPRPVAQGRDAPGRLERDPRGHLRLAEPALAEADRDLDDAQAELTARARSARPGRRSPARRRLRRRSRCSAAARKHLKPPVRSRTSTPSTRRAYPQPAREMTRRCRPQFSTPPPCDVARAEHEVGARRAPARSAAAGRPGRARGRRPSRPRSRRPRPARARSRRCRRGPSPALPGRCRTSTSGPRGQPRRRARRCRRASCRRRRARAPRARAARMPPTTASRFSASS